MAKRGSETQTPGLFMFKMNTLGGQKFRQYCYENRLFIGGVLEDLVLKHLVEKGIIPSKESLGVINDT